jgi:hypothetical protein
MIFNEEPYDRNDPYARQREIFPRLAPEIHEYIASCGTD